MSTVALSPMSAPTTNREIALQLLAMLCMFLLILALFFALWLIIEILLELLFLCYVAIRRPSRRRNGKDETSPLLGEANHAVSRHRKYTLVAGQYLALDIAGVDMNSLQGGARISALPIRVVQLPVDDASEVAVLSWRWDFKDDAPYDRSPNVACAIQYAKSSGIRYLFVDTITVDQSLPQDPLMEQVARFGILYSTIPVIAAYDIPHLGFDHAVFRPWILSEIKRMRHNPHKITYVGYCQSGTEIDGCLLNWLFRFVPRSQINMTAFTKALRTAWRSSYISCALHVLNGAIDMTNIHDFKFILPELEEVCIAAERLDRNDYLLMVALMEESLASNHDEALAVESSFTELQYSVFRIETEEERHADGEVTNLRHIIYWGFAPLACFELHGLPLWTDRPLQYSVTIHPRMRLMIFRMLGLGQDAYERFELFERNRQASLQWDRVVPDPFIDAVEL